MLRATLAALALGSLACASPQLPAQTRGPQPAAAPPASMPAPSAYAIQVAGQIGLPQVVPGSGVAGPFEGPQGTIFYVNSAGLISWFNPQTFQAYMGRMDTGELVYGMALDGFYAFQDGQAVNIGSPPAELGSWPHAESMAMVMVYALQNQQAQQGAQPMGSDAAYYQAMSEASATVHEINMGIIENMGSTGCIEHYDGIYYLGCY